MGIGMWLTGDAKMDKSEEGGMRGKARLKLELCKLWWIERLTNALNALNVVANRVYRRVVCNPWMS